jgi:glutathionylspermidine synthase
VGLNLSVLLEDSRFEEAKLPKKKKLPHQLHWFVDQDYFSNELLGVQAQEVQQYQEVAEKAYQLFVSATNLVIEENRLISFGIPTQYKTLFEYTWNKREDHPYLYGRFDINGVLNGVQGKVIEFNADTCSTLPETLLLQKIHLDQLKGDYASFNYLEESLHLMLGKLKAKLPEDYQPAFLGSSLGYEEDVQNVGMILEAASSQGFHPVYRDLPEVNFSEEGVFVATGDDYMPIDVLFKFFPWDWAINEEPSLMQVLSDIILNEKCIVLNPFYTTLWQNKKFLAFITERFPDNTAIAKTYKDKPFSRDYVSKPVLGRIGENIRIVKTNGQEFRTNGDYGSQDVVYQEYVANPIDKEDYSYQAGVFMVGHKAVALNYRCSEKEIINDDCEFMAHFIKEV